MQGFKDSSRMLMEHSFPRSTVQIAPHARMMPTKAPAAAKLASQPSIPAGPTLKVTPPLQSKLAPRIEKKPPMGAPASQAAMPNNDPTADDLAMAKGGHLNAAARKGLSKSEFGLPGSRKYPMPDKSHAANAKARATQMVNAGKLSEASKVKIDSKADRVLGKARGGGVKVASRTPMISPKSGC